MSNLRGLDADPDAYRTISETLASTGVYGTGDGHGAIKPTAFRPPLYPYVLSWMVRNGQLPSISVAVLHVLLGALTVTFTFMAARHVFPDDRGGVICRAAAAALVAIDPILLRQSTLVMTETLAALLVSITIWWWVSRCALSPTLTSVAALGAWLALAYLCRPTFLVWAVFLSIVLLVSSRESWPIRLARFSVFAGPMMAAVFGWTIRNQNSIGHPVWATTHGGYTLLLANNPLFYSYLRSGKIGQPWDAQSFLIAYNHRYDGDPNTDSFWKRDWQMPIVPVPVESETADDRRCYEAARATIQREKGTFVWSCLVRLGRLWSPFPHQGPERSRIAVYAVGCYYVLFWAIGFAGLVRLYRRTHLALWWPVITLVIALSIVHSIYWSNLRMRAPAVPGLAIVAAGAFLPKQPHAETDNQHG